MVKPAPSRSRLGNLLILRSRARQQAVSTDLHHGLLGAREDLRSLVEFIGRRHTRELIVGNYRVVYRLRGRRVGIIAVVQGSRNLLQLLAAEAWDLR